MAKRASKKKGTVINEPVALVEPPTVAAVLEQSPIARFLASHQSKAKIDPERPMPEPDTDGSEAAAAFKRQHEREQAVAEPTKSHVQQLGPRKRAPNEPGSVYTGKDFKLLKDADRWYFEFEQEPTEERLRVLKQLDFRPKRDPKTLAPNTRAWQSYDWAKATAHAQSAAVWMDGKDISHGRGA